MVHDYDVMCIKCNVSLCHDCATTWDLLSEICILFAKINVLSNPTMTIRELNNFLKLIKLEQIYNNLLKYIKLEEMTQLINGIFNIVIQYENLDENQDINPSDILQIIDISESALLDDLLRDSFVCFPCHNNIKTVIY